MTIQTVRLFSWALPPKDSTAGNGSYPEVLRHNCWGEVEAGPYDSGDGRENGQGNPQRTRTLGNQSNAGHAS